MTPIHTLEPKDLLEIRQLRELDDLNGLFEIMAFLERYQVGTISNFIKDLRLNQQPVYRTLERLEKLGIVRTTPESKNRSDITAPIYYELTELGKNISKPFGDLSRLYFKQKH